MSTPIDQVQKDVEQRVARQQQALGDMVQIGRVINPTPDVDPLKPNNGAYVLVHIGGDEPGTFTRNWMPWITPRSGVDSEWWAPEADEQVVVIAPSGNLSLGVIVGTIFRGEWLSFPENNGFTTSPNGERKIPDSKSAHIHKRSYQDGSSIVYDKREHSLDMTLIDTSAAEKSSLSIQASLASGKPAFKLVLDQSSKQTSIDAQDNKIQVEAPQGISFKVGENTLELTSDGFSITVGANKIEVSSTEIKLEAGTKLTIDSAGADVT